MKIDKSLILIMFTSCMFMLGCATITPEQATIKRVVPVPKQTLTSMIESKRAEWRFNRLPDGRLEWTVLRQKDPILGLITISDTPDVAIRFSMTVTALTDKSCVLTILPVIAYRKFNSDLYREKPLSLIDSDRKKITAFADAVIAEAEIKTQKL